MNQMLNACELEIDLFCRGLRVPSGASLEGARDIGDANAGLASGLELVIPTGSRIKPQIWVNVPVREQFARASPYVLGGSPGSYLLHDERDGAAHPVIVPPRPAWYDRLTSRDIPMSRIGTLSGTSLQIQIHPACAFWDTGQKCSFCTTARGERHEEIAPRTVEDVVETCWAAKEHSGVTYVQLSGGFQGAHGLEFADPFVRAIKQDVGLLVGVALPPERDFDRYTRLADAGADRFSFCLDLLDAYWFTRICPGRARTLGQALFFKVMEHCASRLPRGAVEGTVIAGIEPIENTIEAIERMVALGVSPSVCIFRPMEGSGMAAWPAPDYQRMRTVTAAMYDACRRARLPIGVAPNLEVGLCVSPEDAALLAPRTTGFYGYELWRRAARVAARPVFGSRLRARPRRIPVDGSHEIGAVRRD